MPSLVEPYARIDRASERVDEIRDVISGYVEANEASMLIKVDGQTVSPIYPKEAPPFCLSLLIGEAVYHLRCALDYLVFQLSSLDSGVYQEKTQFLIEDCLKSFAKRKGRYLRGLSAEHIAAVEALQPYRGHTWIQVLRDMSNMDKHRTIHVISVAGNAVVNVGGTEDEAHALGGFAIPGEVGMYYHSTLLVAFSDKTPIMDTMQGLVMHTRNVLDAFQPEFEVA